MKKSELTLLLIAVCAVAGVWAMDDSTTSIMKLRQKFGEHEAGTFVKVPTGKFSTIAAAVHKVQTISNSFDNLALDLERFEEYADENGCQNKAEQKYEEGEWKIPLGFKHSMQIVCEEIHKFCKWNGETCVKAFADDIIEQKRIKLAETRRKLGEATKAVERLESEVRDHVSEASEEEIDALSPEEAVVAKMPHREYQELSYTAPTTKADNSRWAVIVDGVVYKNEIGKDTVCLAYYRLTREGGYHPSQVLVFFGTFGREDLFRQLRTSIMESRGSGDALETAKQCNVLMEDIQAKHLPEANLVFKWKKATIQSYLLGERGPLEAVKDTGEKPSILYVFSSHTRDGGGFAHGATTLTGYSNPDDFEDHDDLFTNLAEGAWWSTFVGFINSCYAGSEIKTSDSTLDAAKMALYFPVTKLESGTSMLQLFLNSIPGISKTSTIGEFFTKVLNDIASVEAPQADPSSRGTAAGSKPIGTIFPAFAVAKATEDMEVSDNIADSTAKETEINIGDIELLQTGHALLRANRQ